ncbi:U-scoloptoxin(01)-Cw1a-like 31, partial [Homarus americanus]
ISHLSPLYHTTLSPATLPQQFSSSRPRAFDFAAEAESVVGELNANFSCDGREYGYYADQSHKCKVFHICMPVKTATGRIMDTFQFSFFCPNQTRFSQDSRTCIDEDRSYPCIKAHTLYDLNKNIGKRARNKKRPINPKAAVTGAHKFSAAAFSGSADAKLSFSSTGFSSSEETDSLFSSQAPSSDVSSGNRQASGATSSVTGRGTPDQVDSELQIGEPVVPISHFSHSSGSSGAQPASFVTGSTGHNVAIGSTAGSQFSTTISENTEPIIPPGSQIFSTVSVNHQNSLSRGTQKDDNSAANVGTSTRAGASSFGSSSRGSSGFSASGTPTTPGSSQLFTSSASSTTSSTNGTPAPSVRPGQNRQQGNTATTINSGAFRITVNGIPISASGHSGTTSVSNRGSNTFSSGSAVTNIQGSPTGFTQHATTTNAHGSKSVAHNEEFASTKSIDGASQDTLFTSSQTLGAVSSIGETIPGSSFTSRGRTQSSSSGSANSFNTNRLSVGSSNSGISGSSNRGSASFSQNASGNLGSSAVTPQPVIHIHQQVTPSHQPISPTHQPVSPAHQPVSPTRQPVSPTRQPVSPTRQPVFSTRQPVTPRPTTPPKTLSSASPLQIPGFSSGIVHLHGEIQSGGVSPTVHHPSTIGVTIPTTTEYYTEEENYDAFITTESAFESERDFNDAPFAGSHDEFGASFSRGSTAFTGGNSVVVSPTSSTGSIGFTLSHNSLGASNTQGLSGSSASHGSTRKRGSAASGGHGSSFSINNQGTSASRGSGGRFQGSTAIVSSHGSSNFQESGASGSGHGSSNFQGSGASGSGHGSSNFQGSGASTGVRGSSNFQGSGASGSGHGSSNFQGSGASTG